MQSITPFNLLNLAPVIIVSNKTLSAIKHIVSIAPQEAQWFHTVEPVVKQNEVVELHLSERLYIPKQNTSMAQVDSTSSMMIEFYNELKEEYSDQNIINQKLSTMTCWCHSHHNMAPNPSGQDISQFDFFVKSALKQNIANWQIMLIFNKKNQFYSKVYDPMTGFVFEGVPIDVCDDYDFAYIDQAAKTKFIKPKPKIMNYNLPAKSWASHFQAKDTQKFNLYKQIKTMNDSIASDALSSIFSSIDQNSTSIMLDTPFDSDALLNMLNETLSSEEYVWYSLLVSDNHDKIKNIFTSKQIENYLAKHSNLIEKRITDSFLDLDILSMKHNLSLSFAISDIDNPTSLNGLFKYYEDFA